MTARSGERSNKWCTAARTVTKVTSGQGQYRNEPQAARAITRKGAWYGCAVMRCPGARYVWHNGAERGRYACAGRCVQEGGGKVRVAQQPHVVATGNAKARTVVRAEGAAGRHWYAGCYQRRM